MELTAAKEILKEHNEWRRGAEIKQQEPKLIGEAIDTVLAHLEMEGTRKNFVYPTDKQILAVCILFNDGIKDEKQLTSMFSAIEFTLDRLLENGNILTPSTKEKKINSKKK